MSDRGRVLDIGDSVAIFFCELALANRQSITLSSNMAGRCLYRDFVELLHRRLVPHRRRIRFRGGWSWRRFAGWWLWGASQSGLSFGSFLVPLFPLLEEHRLEFRRDRPRRYRPESVPDCLLPDLKAVSPA
ncbi:hypothetical protein LJ725_18515 [Reyranella aquatilis]|uniref:Uncharacterized protein n=1 Tax=Reyranella aquatilis TaxID=2035356 RepID=A0ABS8KY00_9HYPH|nr:hypothetical protein [Reyranella aquatilis]